MQILACLSFPVGWLRGGHTERFAAAVLFCDYVFTRSIAHTAAAHELVAAAEFVLTLIFIWMAFRSERWWTIAASAALALCALVYVLDWTNPDLPRDAAISAQIGLWMVVYTSLMAGVAERWLAGERAVSRSVVWRRQRTAS